MIEYAIRTGLKVAPQGTGHNAAALGALDGTILLSTQRMRGVEIDAEARTARVQAGTLWLEVTEAATPHGLFPLSGSSPDVGVVGYTLGGGLSWLARRHGLAANAVTAIELVTPDAQLVRATADVHPDLFWALRGGGGNFGVVTAMEFDLFPYGEVFAGMLLWPYERHAEVLRAWHALTETAPEELTTALRIMHFPPLPELPPFLSGRSVVVIDGAYAGSAEEGAAAIAALRALEPEMDTFAPSSPAVLSRIHMDPEEPMPVPRRRRGARHARRGGARRVRGRHPAGLAGAVRRAAARRRRGRPRPGRRRRRGLHPRRVPAVLGRAGDVAGDGRGRGRRPGARSAPRWRRGRPARSTSTSSSAPSTRRRSTTTTTTPACAPSARRSTPPAGWSATTRSRRRPS